MKSKGLISIIMNCHNGEAFLNEAIQSVLKQKYKKWELIFWNNNSTDNSEKVFKSYRDKRPANCFTRINKSKKFWS